MHVWTSMPLDIAIDMLCYKMWPTIRVSLAMPLVHNVKYTQTDTNIPSLYKVYKLYK